MEPKVSVIIPIYNTGKYLPKCVESVRNQTLRELEIILVDDESPDNAPSLCDKYAREDGRIKVVHKKNGGLGFARNSGLNIATGEYVAFIDSDDFISFNMMETLYQAAKEYDADEVRSGTILYKNGNGVVRRDVEQTKVYRGAEEVRSFIFDLLGPLPEEARDVKYMMSVWLAIHKRSVIEENNVRFTSERDTLSEDMIFNLDLLPKMRIIVLIPDCFYYYRINNNSLSHSFSIERNFRRIKFLTLVEERLSRFYSYDDYKLHYQRLMFLYLRGAISGPLRTKDSMITKYRNVRSILYNDFWNSLLYNYPYERMEIKHKCYFYVLRKRWTVILMIANKLFL